MLKSLTIGLAAAGIMAFAGAAQAGTMDNYYGNTLVLTYPNNVVVKAFINADGSFSTVAPDGSTSKGTWKTVGSQVCYAQTDPAPAAGAQPVCTPDEAHDVGKPWTDVGMGGATFTAVIQAGR